MSEAEKSGPDGRGLRAVVAQNFDVWNAIGGVRGLIETTAPGIVFVVTFIATDALIPSIAAPLIASLVLIALRLIQRLDTVPALSGLFGVAISALVAWRSGEALDYFIVGLIQNGGYAAALLISMLVRWPAMGLVVGFLRSDVTGWRSDPTQKLTKRRYWQITWLWFALFALRFLLQLPLYLLNLTTALGVVKLVMGVGPFALLIWLTWMMVRNLPPVPSEDSVPD